MTVKRLNDHRRSALWRGALRTWRKLRRRPERHAMDPDVLNAWRRDRGDQTLRLRYPLDSGSVVVDVGGYEGQWASDVYAMYGCRIHVLEPIPPFAVEIERRFAANPRISVHRYALTDSTGTSRMSQAGDASSRSGAGAATVGVATKSAQDFFTEEGLWRVDLMKVNIEGDEYALLGHLLDTGLIDRIRHLQIQFHSFVPDAAARRRALQERLRRTHELSWEYPFVWESWRRRAP